jgi:hypothetical protein
MDTINKVTRTLNSPLECGSFRLRVRFLSGEGYVGNFLTLRGAGNYAHDLLAELPSLESIRVEFRDRRGWHSAWSVERGRAHA